MAEGFTIGSKFDSFVQFKEKLDLYKKSTFSDFFIKDSKTLGYKISSCPLRLQNVDEALKYYYIKFKCVHGGHFKKKRTTSERKRNTSSMRQGCNAYIHVTLSNDGKKLVIADMCDKHNHELNQELFDSLPRQRRRAPDVKQDVLDMLELMADKELVQEKYSPEFKKGITLSDLTNLEAEGNTNHPSFEEIISTVEKDHDCTVKVLLDEHQNLRALFLQDKKMQKEFEAYPEVLFADCTYKLTDISSPIFVLMVENGNGELNVVAAGVFISEKKDIYRWFLESFKSLNPSSVKTRIVLTDKHMTKKVVFKEVLPNVRLRIRLSHTLKIFRREISVQKMGLSPQEVALIGANVRKMCYATSLEEFNELYEEFEDISPEIVIEYFAKYWKEIIDEWTMVSDFQADTLFHGTNNRVKCFNAKLKSLITHFSSLEKFLEHFFVVIKCLRLEREASRAKVFSIFATKTFQSEEEQLYSLYVTPYAFHLIEKQFQSLSVVTQEICIKYATTENYCSCPFFNSLHLPCKHILKVREGYNTSLFDTNLVDFRWSRKYFGLTYELPRQSAQHSPVDEVTRKVGNLTLQKFQKACVITKKLATLISESSKAEDKMKLLEKIHEKWAKGEEVQLFCDKDDSPPQNLPPPNCELDDLHDSPNYTNEEIDDHQDSPPSNDQVLTDRRFIGDLHDSPILYKYIYKKLNAHQDSPPTTDQVLADQRFVATAQMTSDHCYASNQMIDIAEPMEVVVETSRQSKIWKTPSKVKVRDRPKGSTLTVISLVRAQKGKKESFTKEKPRISVLV